MCFLPFPDSLREEEIIGFNFSREGVLRDAKESISIVIVIVPSSVLMLDRSP
jgi:hypothetical protein